MAKQVEQLETRVSVTGVDRSIAEMRRFGGQINSLNVGMKAFAGLLGGAGIGMAATSFIRASVRDANAAEMAIFKLRNAVKTLGGSYADVSRLAKQAKTVMRATGVDDDYVMSLMASAGALKGVRSSQLAGIAQAGLYAARARGMDPEALTTGLGRYVGTGVMSREIKKLELGLSGATDQATRYAEIQNLITANQGAMNEYLSTGTGALERINTSIGNFREEVGAKFAPVLNVVANILDKLSDFTLVKVIAGIVAFAAIVGATVAPVASLAGSIAMLKIASASGGIGGGGIGGGGGGGGVGIGSWLVGIGAGVGARVGEFFGRPRSFDAFNQKFGIDLDTRTMDEANDHYNAYKKNPWGYRLGKPYTALSGGASLLRNIGKSFGLSIAAMGLDWVSNNTSGNLSKVLRVLSSTAMGAGIGAPFGPYGALAGGVAGLAYGLYEVFKPQVSEQKTTNKKLDTLIEITGNRYQIGGSARTQYGRGDVQRAIYGVLNAAVI